jgi:solute carrier family 39 (zinc transporter), member 7
MFICSIVQSKCRESSNSPNTASSTAKLFSFLFPSSAAINALLATAYILGPPNFLLALCPPNIDPSSLTVMVAFAIGGLLGDTLFHLLPEIFLGEDHPEVVRFMTLEPNRNLLLGVVILVGFVTFVAMDKALRIATGESGHSHKCGHLAAVGDKHNIVEVSSHDTTHINGNGELKERKRKPLMV